MPSKSLVRDPDMPRVAPNDPVTPTFPAKLEPEIVATTESLMAIETSPEFPPPVSPVPAVIEVISPTVPSFVMTTWPLEEEEIEIPAPAAKYDVPSSKFVRDPENPSRECVVPLITVSPAKTALPVREVPRDPTDPDTKKFVSDPILNPDE